MNDVTLSVVAYDDHQHDIQHIRRQVFIIEQGIPESLEWDEFEQTSWHVLAYQNDQAIGTGRLQPNGKITRIAVLKNARQQGIASLLLSELLELATRQGLNNLHLNAQTTATGLYEKYGFRAVGEVFDEGGIEHIRMLRP